jgi:outer membrane receptor protein involved in Fe transport
MSRGRKRKLNRMSRAMAGVQMASTLLAGATAAYAQQAASAANEATTLEEIAVTAQKRSENLQSVPISVAWSSVAGRRR